ncbi:MAG: hypothetical protein LAT68_00690 [Cyclobacteriaceae bacterium]|nr:hypothetical protein [Cyclobacteriaceae bacterium]MCH8514820.1 hypothetical protein [Cyclobacteriaceae bacterium]
MMTFTMKNLSLILLLLVIFTGELAAQERHGHERMREMRKNFILERVSLSDEQIADFWEEYESIWHKRKQIRKQHRLNQSQELSVTELRQREIDLRKQELELKEEELSTFTKHLSDEQIRELEKAEMEFRDMVMEYKRKKRQEKSSESDE